MASDLCPPYDTLMLERSPGEWARVCRSQAALTSNKETRAHLLKMAADYEAEAAISSPSLSSLFYDEASGTFSDAFVFEPSAERMTNGERNFDVGHWRCDLANDNRLKWSDEVYDLFGLLPGTPIDREWAVGRYQNGSRTTLERVREYAIERGVGFILDAEIKAECRRPSWIRVLAVPIYDRDGQVVRLEGLKRDL